MKCPFLCISLVSNSFIPLVFSSTILRSNSSSLKSFSSWLIVNLTNSSIEYPSILAAELFASINWVGISSELIRKIEIPSVLASNRLRYFSSLSRRAISAFLRSVISIILPITLTILPLTKFAFAVVRIQSGCPCMLVKGTSKS